MCFVQYRMMRSYDDADILRRSDNSVLVHEVPASRAGAGETLPRLKSSNIKPKPVAKIIANSRSSGLQQLGGGEEGGGWDEVSWNITVSCNIPCNSCRRLTRSSCVIVFASLALPHLTSH